MSEERPLHVQVAEALGWTAHRSWHGYWFITEPDGTRHEDGYGMSSPKFDSETGEPLPPRQWWDEFDPPRFDDEWETTGPLIEIYGLELSPCETCEWVATKHWTANQYNARRGPTPLVAACRLIVALHAAGKL